MALTNCILARTSIGVDFSLMNRLNVNAFDCCCGGGNFFENIRSFFAHGVADVRMFCHAFSSIGFGSVTSDEIGDRIHEVSNFRNVVLDRRSNPHHQFSDLSQETRDLFHLVDRQYLDNLANQTDPEVAAHLRQEVIRECDRVIAYQRTMSGVNAFFQSILNRASGEYQGRQGGNYEPVSSRVGMTLPNGASMVRGTDVGVPDTVAYVQGEIPTEVQNNANAIAQLKTAFAALANAPTVPNQFSCPVAMDLFEIPVFDASHPVVQQDLAALRGAAAAGNGETLALNALNARRDQWHTLEKDSLEGHISSGHSWAPAKCPMCRHPEHGGIRREFLRIDVGLQKEILTFLRNAVPAAVSTT